MTQTKRIIIFIAIVTALTVSAIFSISVNAWTYNKEAYRSMIESFGEKCPYEKEFVDYWNSQRTFEGYLDDGTPAYSPEIYHIYTMPDGTSEAPSYRFIEEMQNGPDLRWFSETGYDFGYYVNYHESAVELSVDEINSCLKENGCKSSVKNKDVYNKVEDSRYTGETLFYMEYEDNSKENVIKTFLVLAKTYDMKMIRGGSYSTYDYYEYDPSVEKMNNEVEMGIELDKVSAMIQNFITKNNLSADTYIDSDTPEEVTVNVYDWQKEKETVEPIKEFMAKNNIDESCVVFMVFEGQEPLLGDANGDGTLNIRDCAEIAKFAAQGKTDSLPDTADYNNDGKKNVRDGAAISKELAKVK